MSARPDSVIRDDIQRLLQSRMLTPCQELKPFGGKFLANTCKIIDGHKYICVERLLRDVSNQNVCVCLLKKTHPINLCFLSIPLFLLFQCLIYSFGFDGEWAFESSLANLGKYQDLQIRCKMKHYNTNEFVQIP